MVASNPIYTSSDSRRDATGTVLIVLAAAISSGIVVLAKLALAEDVPVTSTLAIRFAISAFVLLVIVTILRVSPVPARGERWGLIGLGAFGYAAQATLFLSALDYGTAAVVTLLFFTYPVLVVLGWWALGRGVPNRLVAICVAVAVVGVAVVVGTGSELSISPIGVLLALASAVVCCGYLLGASRLLRRTSALTASLWISASASAGLILFAIVGGSGRLPDTWRAWGPILGMGIASASVFLCVFAGIQRLGPVRYSVISSVEPISTAGFATALLGEPLRFGTVLGGALVVAAATTAALVRTPSLAHPSNKRR